MRIFPSCSYLKAIGSWREKALIILQYGAYRKHLPRSASGRPALCLHYGDMTDSTNLIRIVQHCQPDEIYNLAAQSHVQVSFETAEYTANADAIGTLRLLEAIRILKLTQ